MFDFHSTGTKWRTRRKLLTPTFHFNILNDFIAVFNEKSQILLRRLADKADGKPFNICQHITLCALDIVCGEGSLVSPTRSIYLLICIVQSSGVSTGCCAGGQGSIPVTES